MKKVLNYLLVLLDVVHVEDEVRLEERMADSAVLPVWLPVLALALTVDHARVDAKRFALNLEIEMKCFGNEKKRGFETNLKCCVTLCWFLIFRK